MNDGTPAAQTVGVPSFFLANKNMSELFVCTVEISHQPSSPLKSTSYFISFGNCAGLRNITIYHGK